MKGGGFFSLTNYSSLPYVTIVIENLPFEPPFKNKWKFH